MHKCGSHDHLPDHGDEHVHGPDCDHVHETPGHDFWLDAPPILPMQLPGNESVADLIDNGFAHSGFNGRRLAEGAQLYARMIDANATVALTVAGAMAPIGLGGAFISLIERGFVDFMIATGANLYHDLHLAYGFPMVQGSAEVDDNALAEDGVARIFDVFIGEEDTLMATDNKVLELLKGFDLSKPFSTARMHHYMGKSLWKQAPHPEKSFVAIAAKYDVPIYTSSPGDSSIGMNLIIPHMFDKPVMLNPVLDVIETAAIVRDADLNGVVEIGGGSPKNFYLQTQPTLHQILMDTSKGGHDFFLQLTADAPHWGGLSGATPGEARSWGKLKDAYVNNVVVYSCASISFPIIAQYALMRSKPRTPRRLFNRLEEMTASLRDAAKKSRANAAASR
jgi:deoxyhypusine synthase